MDHGESAEITFLITGLHKTQTLKVW